MRKVTVEDLMRTPESFMLSSTTCGPCNVVKSIHKASDFPYLNFDEDTNNVRMYIQSLDVIKTPMINFPSIIELRDGEWVHSGVGSTDVSKFIKNHGYEYTEYTESKS